MKRIVFFLFFIVGMSYWCSGQVDTEFWFVLPEISQRPASGGGTTYDRPSRFVITTADKSATVTLSKPADNSFVPIVLQLNANETKVLTFSNYVDEFENRPANTILNKGIYISATERISVYYENLTANTEIFVLKGKQALGMEFFTPFQTQYDNSESGIYSPDPKSAFDIVATENNTIINITPTQNIVGRPKNTPFAITLNKGETYSAEALSNEASLHLQGSYIKSDKPIAVTVKDDLVHFTGQFCRDLIGDQIVPVDHLGKEYVHIKGELNDGDYIYYLATEDNTQLFMNDEVTPRITLNRGEQTMFRLGGEDVLYFRSTAPIYSFQVSGYDCELAGGLVPRLYCSGVNKVSFTRPDYANQSCNLIVPKGGEGNFKVNGLIGVIKATDFKDVPGTNGKWLYAKINDNPAFQPNTTSTIENSSHIFHISLFNGERLVSASMCFFSTFELRVFLPQQVSICQNNPYQLDAGPGYDSYLWSDGSTQQSLNVSQSGKYWVKVTKDGCEASDTSLITISDRIILSDTLISPTCEGKQNGKIELTVTGGKEPYRFKWSNGGSTNVINNLASGSYSVTIQDANDCESIANFTVPVEKGSNVLLEDSLVFCKSVQYTLKTNNVYDTYLWSDGSTKSELSVNQAGKFWIRVTKNGCEFRDTIKIILQEKLLLKTTATNLYCDEDTTGTIEVKVIGGIAPFNYKWPDGVTDNPRRKVKAGTYSVIVTDDLGCEGMDTIEVKQLSLKIDLGEDKNLCDGTDINITLDAGSGFDSYLWSDGSLNRTLTIRSKGEYSVVARKNNCQFNDKIKIDTYKLELRERIIQPKCLHETNGSIEVTVAKGVPPYRYLWSNQETGNIIRNLPDGEYSVTVMDANNCQVVKSYTIASQISGKPMTVDFRTRLMRSDTLYLPEAIVELINQSVNVSTFEWVWDDGLKRKELNTSRTFTEEGKYCVQLFGTNADGCKDSSVVKCFEVVHPLDIHFPNAFTPNLDGINDFYYPIFRGIFAKFQLSIYDRWGVMVFDATNPLDKWDGSFSGKQVPEGVYFYVARIEYNTPLQLNKIVTGNITLIR